MFKGKPTSKHKIRVNRKPDLERKTTCEYLQAPANSTERWRALYGALRKRWENKWMLHMIENAGMKWKLTHLLICYMWLAMPIQSRASLQREVESLYWKLKHLDATVCKVIPVLIDTYLCVCEYQFLLWGSVYLGELGGLPSLFLRNLSRSLYNWFWLSGLGM